MLYQVTLMHLPLHLLYESLCHRPVLPLPSTGRLVELLGDLPATQRVEGDLLLLVVVMGSHGGALEA